MSLYPLGCMEPFDEENDDWNTKRFEQYVSYNNIVERQRISTLFTLVDKNIKNT